MRLSVILAILLGFALSASARAQPYVIDSFEVFIQLRKDGVMEVEERIAVTFNEPRRGIFRFIPIHYDDGRGKTRSIFLSSVSVEDHFDRPLPTKITREGPNLKIRIGEEDVFYPGGTRKTYVIRYHVEGMLNWFEEAGSWEKHPELYWNVNGDQWDTSATTLSVVVHFPTPPKPGAKARIFAGAYGTRDSDVFDRRVEDAVGPSSNTLVSFDEGVLICRRNEPTQAFEGLTFVLALPPGTIDRPTFLKQAKWLLLPNLGFTIPFWTFAAMWFFWSRFGRDPRAGAIAVQFDPPDNLSGPEAGAMVDEHVDQRDIVAGIFSLAVKGFLTMTPTEEGLIFKKRGAKLRLTDGGDPRTLTPFETYLLSLLKKCGAEIDTTDMRTHVAPHVGDLHNKLYDSLVDHGYYYHAPNTVRGAWTVGGLVAVGALGFLFMWLSPFKSVLPSIVGGVVGAIVVFFFARQMPRRTVAGAKARDQVLGFFEFIQRARGQEFEWMSKKQPDMALFETFLPHAVAFGLVQEWAGAFEGYLKEMPNWYHAPPGTMFHPMYFASDLGDISNGFAAAAATPPRSSGASGGSSGFSSGGGFSGGGLGGGGGGSW